MEKSLNTNKYRVTLKNILLVCSPIFALLMLFVNFWTDEVKATLVREFGADVYLAAFSVMWVIVYILITLFILAAFVYLLAQFRIKLQNIFVKYDVLEKAAEDRQRLKELELQAMGEKSGLGNPSDECANEKFDRFGDIRDLGVKVGFIPFEPTLQFRGGEMVGPGAEFIGKIFNGLAQPLTTPTNWADVLDELSEEKFDILATPVYDFPIRRKEALLSMPLYYANMGFYVSNKSTLGRMLHEKTPLSFQELKKVFLTNDMAHANITTDVNEGELNEKILKKHFPNVGLVQSPQDFEVDSALGQLADSSSQRQIVICEKWIAEKNVHFRDGRISNLLADKELLYPVVFMMRRCEETLRKFVNLRLLHMQKMGDFVDLFIKGLNNTGTFVDGDGDILEDYFYRGHTTHDRFLSGANPKDEQAKKVSYLRKTKN